MSETRAQYLVSGLPEDPNKYALLKYTDPDFCEPTLQDIRCVIRKLGELTGSEIAGRAGVDSRVVRKWLSPPESPNHKHMPYAVWRLLLIEANLVESPGNGDMHGQQ
ncbi:hypothetical protein LT85_p040 (plasmid) [Collimonas arenae]|uniref:Uncharacterized protein n=1 Tax=Collimonas arenae TaxID=279058 RepID=A0A0A1FKL3_9BURK|nr:hypothetical protein [Collimonas arenae]AIY44219.1 hypothetical protein LT85_p040 [Collimonas arenae]